MISADSPIDLIWEDGLRARIDPWGACLALLRAPDRTGLIDLILPATPGLAFDPTYMGRLIGRYANRVAKASFDLGGRTWPLIANDGINQLHGGPTGLHTKLWDVLDIQTQGARRVVLSVRSAVGDGGYPGEVQATATYDLTPDALGLSIEATTDAPTPVSLTLHPYFNLAGSTGGTIDDHRLILDADTFLDVDAAIIPRPGAPTLVHGSPFDFRDGARIGERLAANDPRLRLAGGLDHAFVLNGGAAAATLTSPDGDLIMRLSTNQPALQVYTGQHLGPPWGPRRGLCLEPHQFPDAVNRPDFPSPIVRPGETFRWESQYAFSGSAGR